MSLDVQIRDLRVNYGRTTAVDGISCTLEAGKIYGLLGRNGAGKTSLLSVVSAFRKATGGSVRVGGEDPFENAPITQRIAFIRESVDVMDTDRVKDVLSLSAALRPNWNQDVAGGLLERFDLNPRKRVGALSLGMKSALRVIVGIASRTPLTIFDEAYLGMDAPSRYAFYEALLADYVEQPRTIILSTHLIEEFGSLFEEVLILDKGRLVIQEEADSLRERGVSITGPAALVDEYAAGLTILSQQRLGGTKSVTIYGALTDQQRATAARNGLELGPVALQDLFIHLTEPAREAS